MMMRVLISGFAISAALSVALPAYAQVTDQTDQSEEDWRKSRKKSGTSDIFRQPNSNPLGTGAPIIDYEPVSPVERLPSESRRHLMRERAKAIAESDDGDISDAEYVPSEAAQSDEQLMREEKEAWDVIVTEMEGSGGTAKSEGGPNKVAVAGQNGSSPAPGSRGGSTRTLQEIMDAIKNGQSSGASGASPQGQGLPSSSTQDTQAAEGSRGPSTEGDSSSSENGSEGQGDAQNGAESQTPSDSSGGSSGDSDQSGDAGSSGDTGDQSGAEATASAQTEPLSPLERIRRAREDGPTRGTERSASDYLGNQPDPD